MYNESTRMIAKPYRTVKQKGYFCLHRFIEMLSSVDEVAGIIIMSKSWNNIKTFSGPTKTSCL